MSEQDKLKYIQMLEEYINESGEIEEVRMCKHLMSKVIKDELSESDLSLLKDMYHYYII